MFDVAVKPTPTEVRGRPHPTPIAVVAGAFRRAWVRIVERGSGGRPVLESAMSFPGDVDSLLALHDIRHGRHSDTPHRVFKAPSLVCDPPVHGSRSAFSAISRGPGTGHSTRLFKPLR